MNIVRTTSFKKAIKKLHKNQKSDLKKAIETIIEDPKMDEMKKGDLAGIQVYKFKMIKQEMLLAYQFEDGSLILTLLGLGSHKNFYRGLKR